KTLLTASWDRTARLWSVPDGQLLGHPLAHQGQVETAAVSSDARFLATGQRDGLVRIWRRPAATTQLVPDLTNRVRLKLSRDGGYATSGRFTNPYFQLFPIPRVSIFALATGQPAGPERTFDEPCIDAALSGDGRLAAAVVGGPDSGSLHVWEVQTGRP